MSRFDLVASNIQERILERVQEIDIFSHFLGYTPKNSVAYLSPILRDEGKLDNFPSFSVFRTNFIDRALFFKDHALNISGDVFKFVQLLYGVKMEDACRIIDREFNLGLYENTRNLPTEFIIRDPSEFRESESIKITVATRPWRSADFKYWIKYGVPESILRDKKFRVFPIRAFRTFEGQENPYPAGYYSYQYRVRDKSKIYQPFSKNRKFRTDFDYKCLEGFYQLDYTSDTLIITKSYKDVMMFRAFGFEAVSPRGENILVPDEYLRHFERKYSKIIVFFDNDGKESSHLYPIEYKRVKLSKKYGVKDPTDFHEKYGSDATSRILNNLLKI